MKRSLENNILSLDVTDFVKIVRLVYVPSLLNPTYQFAKGKFTLPVPALDVRTEQTPGNYRVYASKRMNPVISGSKATGC